MPEKKKPETAPAKKRAPRKKAAKNTANVDELAAAPPALAPDVSPDASSDASSDAAQNGTRPVPRRDLERLADVAHPSPHSLLGAHPSTQDGVDGAVVRAMGPNAERAECVLPDGRVVQLERIAEGLTDVYQCFIPGMTPPFSYRLRFHYADGAVWEREDPYR